LLYMLLQRWRVYLLNIHKYASDNSEAFFL
jgi:hypothetical protein